jgi:hypothetical protein
MGPEAAWCPWDSDSGGEDEDAWHLASVARYSQLVMGRLPVPGARLAVAPAGRALALAGGGQLALYSVPGRLVAAGPEQEGLTSSRDWGLLAGTMAAGELAALAFLGEERLVVGREGRGGVELWTWAEGGVVERVEDWGGTAAAPEAVAVQGNTVVVAGGGRVARRGAGAAAWEERAGPGAAATALLVESDSVVWSCHSGGQVARLDWREAGPAEVLPSGPATPHSALVAGPQGPLVATLAPATGLLQLREPRQAGSLGELQMAPGLAGTPQLGAGPEGRLLVALEGEVHLVAASGEGPRLLFCHDGHQRAGGPAQVRQPATTTT